MNKTLCLFATLFAFPFLLPMSAGEESYPKKNPVLKYEAPEKWETEVDETDGSISINSPDGRISVNFASVPVEATMEVFAEMLPAMVKDLKDAVVTEKAKEHTEDGLTGYLATYVAKIEDKPAMCIFVLFKGGKDHAVLGNIIVADPETLPKESSDKLGKFMQSMKGAAK